MKEIIKKEYNVSGITLVALVITIIILLILAGISIASLTGSGLFENAKLAQERSKNAQDKEEGILGEYENEINQYIGGVRNSEQNVYSLDEKVFGKWIDNKTIYCKTFEIASVPTIGSWNEVISDFNITNIDKMIKYEGMVSIKNASNNRINISIGDSLGYTDEWNVYGMLNSNSFSIYVGSRFSFDAESYGYITIYYTKI